MNKTVNSMKSFHPKKAVTFATIKKSRKMENRKYNSRRFVLVFAALLSAFGPFMTDLYLPAFPELMEYFGTTTSLIQLSLTFGVIGLAAGQLVIGPLSDKYGRRCPLILSLTVFVVSTLICLLCRDVITFICFRLLQGIAAAGGVVISRSIAVDLYEGKEFTRFFAMLSAVQGLAPIVAPIAGGLLLGITDWRGIFAVLLLIGVAILAAAFRFRESLPEERRQTGSVLATFANFRSVLGNKHFVCYMLIQSFAMGVLFAYISSSPFIFQTEYGLTPVMYSLFCFQRIGDYDGKFDSSEIWKRRTGIGYRSLLSADSFACIGRLPDGRLVRGCDRNRIFGIAFLCGHGAAHLYLAGIGIGKKEFGECFGDVGILSIYFRRFGSSVSGTGRGFGCYKLGNCHSQLCNVRIGRAFINGDFSYFFSEHII